MSSIIKVDTIQDQDGNNIINENANTITIGKSGDTVTVALGATFVGGGIEWQSTIVTTSTLTAVAGKGYWIDTTSNACTVTLPASASAGDQIIFVDYARTWNTNNVTINQNSLNFQGYTSPNPVYDTDGQTVNIVYSGATQGWIPVSDDDVTLETPQTYDIDFLVIAGGGQGGCGDYAGGGGAGGYRISTQSVSAGTTITVTVGDGGSGASSPSAGTSGSDSSISGTGLTTITSAGGGGGGGPSSTNGLNGGSGGGGSSNTGGTGGSGNTPSVSPSQGNNGGNGVGSGNYYGGGGGGADAVGANGGSTQGTGGTGTASSITGSSVTRGGGGSGGTYNGTLVSGGTGGGGDGGTAPPGSPSNTPATNGTANTGGGGGGNGANPQSSGTGGSGVVILSMPDADYSTTITGSPTVATGVSGKTVLTFTGSGSYTT
jgi:hypothetical protein